MKYNRHARAHLSKQSTTMSARPVRERKTHKETGYSYIVDDDSSSNSSSVSYDSEEFDDDDDLNESEDHFDNSTDNESEHSSSISTFVEEEEDGDEEDLPNRERVRRKLCFDHCATPILNSMESTQLALDFLLGSVEEDDEDLSPPLKKVKKTHCIDVR